MPLLQAAAGDSSPPFGLIEMVLVFGVVLALAIAELISLKRAQRRHGDHATTDDGDARKQ